MRDKVTLQCTECKRRNYVTTKNKKRTPGKLKFKKYDPKIRKHVDFKESKMK